MRVFIVSLALIAALPAPAFAQPTAFQSIELRGGGTVNVRYGATRSVTVRKANPDRAVRVEGERLVIDRCGGACRFGHPIEVDVVTPEIGGLAVSDGGLVRLQGEFPRQAAVAASVTSGGTIDIRLLAAASVSAAVSQGGRILTAPRRDLAASVSNGGNVTYWGDAVVTSSVRRGGVVVRGAAADLDAPVAQLDPPLPILPRLPVPPTPPAPPRIR